MSTPTSILELDDSQIQFVLTELELIDKNIKKKVDYVQLHAPGISEKEALEYVVIDNPILWAKVYLDWESRGYQDEMLLQGKKSKRLVLRLGRRLGKTECLCILILWYSFTQMNQGDNPNVYDILIVTPFETQIDLIFDRVHQLIDMSPLLKDSIKRDVYHRIELFNGTHITGLTAGSKSGNGAANTRGQHADILMLDECDYMGSSEITNIINIANDDPGRVKILASSTPSGKHEEFYKWCTGASHKYSPCQSDIDNFCFSGYVNTEIKGGNGWTEIFAPSIVNSHLLDINPDTDQTYLADIRDQLSEMRFVQEVMAEFGEEEFGVYQKKYLQMATDEGTRLDHRYTTDYTPEELQAFLSKPRTGPRILGCDWDKYGATTNFVCIELDKLHIDAFGRMYPVFKILFRMEVPRTEFTYTIAVNKIIELNDQYNFDYISVDRGYGETQIEILHRYGMENPETELYDKVVGFQFGQKLEVRDPYTGKKDKKHLKPFMVNNSVVLFERQKIILNPNDKKMLSQLEAYRVMSRSTTGMPIYSDGEEHIVDAMNLAFLIFEQKYGALLKRIISTKIIIMDSIDPPDNVKDRSLKVKDEHKFYALVNMGGRNGYIRDSSSSRRVKSAPFSRGGF